MTVTGEDVPVRTQLQRPPARDPRRPSGGAVREVCPYLAGDGGWRSIQPTREHRCGATHPPAAPSVGKQRDLCLRPAHVACATFLAAREVEAATSPAGPDPAGGLWPPTRGAVLALEPVRGTGSGKGGVRARGGGQAMLVGLMVVAFLVLMIARNAAPSGGGAAPSSGAPAAVGALSPSLAGSTQASSSPSTSEAPASAAASGALGASPSAAVPSASAGALGASPSTAVPSPSSLAPSPSPSAVASATPRPTAKPTARPTATPIPAGATRYTVKSGDTLSSIAAAHGVTVKALMRANGLTSTVIHAGQVLVIP